MLREIKDALGGWKQAEAFFKAATGGGETLEARMKKAKRPYVKVEMLLVTKEHQGQGWMRLLMEFAYEKGREKRAAVILDTDAKGKCDRYVHLGMKLDNVRETAEEAMRLGLCVFDTAQDYGFGEGQRMIGRICPAEALISAKFTPPSNYKPGQVRRSFEKDCRGFGIQFWAWAVLEEGILVPICGCRKPYQAKQLAEAVAATLTSDELRLPEETADALDLRVLGADMFRFAAKTRK